MRSIRNIWHGDTASRGFTLIELMISIMMVLLLILGINTVFSVSSGAVSAGNRLSEMTRDLRATQAVLDDDFKNRDATFLIINSMVNYHSGLNSNMPGDGVGTFFNHADALANGVMSVWNENPGRRPNVRDLNGDHIFGDPNVPGEIVRLAIYDNRNCRVDRVIFPRLGTARRQTADDGEFVSNTISGESLVYVGHMMRTQPNGDPPCVNPVTGVPWYDCPLLFDNVEQILGRVQILLKEGATEQAYQWVAPSPTSPARLAPFGRDCRTQNGTPYGDCRYDLANTSISKMRNDIATYESYKPTKVEWWKGFLYATATTNTNSPDFWTRFRYNPYLAAGTKPKTSASMASAVPVLLQNCSQFIVEFAGDYFRQAPDGTMTAVGSDGELDFVMDTSRPDPNNPGKVINDQPPMKRVRWYGLPRDVNGDGIVLGPLASRVSVRPLTATRDLVDVVPVADFYNMLNGSLDPLTKAPFEKERPVQRSSPSVPWIQYISVPFDSTNEPLYAQDWKYTCVFTKPEEMPWMIRTLIKLEDPKGYIQNGQWGECTFKLR